jgi:hypothetical protein
MGAFDKAMPGRQRRGDQAANPKLMQAEDDTDYIDNGVKGTHLMEMNLFHRDAVNSGFGPGQGQENFAGPCDHRFIQIACLKQGENGRQGAEILASVAVHPYPDAADGMVGFLADVQIKTRQVQFGKLSNQDPSIKAGMEEGTEQHVAADP